MRMWLLPIVGAFLVLLGASHRSVPEIAGGALFIALAILAPALRRLPSSAKQIPISDPSWGIEHEYQTSGDGHNEGQGDSDYASDAGDSGGDSGE
jgi:hypothetical protein